MASAASDPATTLAPTVPRPVKVVVTGGFGAGKTTFISTVSEIEPLTTEAALTVDSAATDRVEHVTSKTTTTVAMDFGRLALGAELWLYLFGAPGQVRFRFMAADLARGSLGGIVMVDSRRLADSFPAIDDMEAQRLPFVVVVNAFDGQITHTLDALRQALALSEDVPLVACDARLRTDVRDALVALVRRALAVSS